MYGVIRKPCLWPLKSFLFLCLFKLDAFFPYFGPKIRNFFLSLKECETETETDRLKIGTLNCKGLADEKKRKDVFNWLRQKKT